MKTNAVITFGFYDTTAKADGELVATQSHPFSQLDKLKLPDELQPKKFAGLEHNYWLLDGSFELLPDIPIDEDIGLWSTVLSGADCKFAQPPMLTVNFAAPHSSSGLTLRFYEPTNDYCRKLQITWYGEGDIVLLSQAYTPDNWLYFAEGKVIDYRKIEVKFLETTAPYRLLKLLGLDYGEKITWNSNNLVSARLRESIDLTCGKISLNTLNLTLHSEDKRFNLYDPKGSYELLQERQALKVAWSIDGVKSDGGTFYLSNWEEANGNPAVLEAYDLSGFLDTDNFKGNMYQNILAGDLIAQIMAVADLPYELDITLAAKPLSGWLPTNTCRECLKNVCYAIGGVVDCSRGEMLRVYPASYSLKGVIPLDRQAMEQTIRQKQLVTGVEIKAHTYNHQLGEDQVLYEEDLPVGEIEIPFTQPYRNVRAETDNANILAYTANYAKVKVSSAGKVTIRGFGYVDSTETIGCYLPTLPAGNKANIITPEDCTLISKDNALEVANRIFDYYQNRYTNDLAILFDGEKVGQVNRLEGMQPKVLEGFAEEIDIDLTGGMVADVKIRGKTIEGVG